MKRIVKASLFAAMFLSSVSFATQASAASSSATPAEKAKIEEVVHQYLIAKPEVIVEAMQVLQNRQVEQAKQSITQTQKDAPRFSKPLFNQAGDPIAGNPNGKVSIVEFFDYQCPHCVDMGPVLDEVIKANPNARIVFKEWPIRGPMSEMAARAALAANKQGKYLEFHRALFGASQQLSQESILEIAKNIGLNVDQFKKDMNDASVTSQLKANMDLAKELKLFGTPAFFIGETTGKGGTITYIPGQMNQVQMQEVIDKVK